VRPSATPAKTNWLTNACGTATAVNSLDERQNSGSAEYPRRTVSYSDHYQDQGLFHRLMDRVRRIAPRGDGFLPVLKTALR
jgi:hypothetical protein